MIAPKPHSPPLPSLSHPGPPTSPPSADFGPHHRSASDPARPKPHLARGGSGGNEQAVEAGQDGEAASVQAVKAVTGIGEVGRSDSSTGVGRAGGGQAGPGTVPSGGPAFAGGRAQPQNHKPRHQQHHPPQPTYPPRPPDAFNHYRVHPQQPPPILGLSYSNSVQQAYSAYPAAGHPPQPHHQPGQPWPPHAGHGPYQPQQGLYQQLLYPNNSAHSPAVSPVASANPSPYHPTVALPPTPNHLTPEWAQHAVSSHAPSPIGGQTVYGDDGTPIPDVDERAHGQPAAYGPSPPASELYSPLQTFGSQEWYALAQMQTQGQAWPGPNGFAGGPQGGYAYGSPGVSAAGYYPPSPSTAFSPHSRMDSGFGSQFTSPEMGGQPFAGAYGAPQFSGHSRGPSARGYQPPPPPQQRGPRAPQPLHPPRGPGPVPPPVLGSPAGPPRSGHLARGQLAQAKLHNALNQTQHGGGQGRKREPSGVSAKSAGGGKTAALPRPPSHSPWALWVGNVPSDSSTEELEAFFANRPPPSTSAEYNPRPDNLPEDLDLENHGVESVHLIARSNCAFVNYVSNLHLQHAIAVTNGLSLRPHDPRIKPLVARERKREEDVKSGVGAQRVGGMHHAYVRKLEAEKRAGGAPTSPTTTASPTSPTSVQGAGRKRMSVGTNHSLSTCSTSSSFLGKHFAKRFFVMKSHDEADLELSVERGLWATQSHNEPILEQAFHTSAEVFLIFSANASGAWFGYARMTGSISGAGMGGSYSSSLRGSLRSSSGSGGSRAGTLASAASSAGGVTSPAAAVVSAGPGGIRAQTIREEGRLFSPSEHRMAGSSPQPFESADGGEEGEESKSPLDEAGELVKQRAMTIGVPEEKVGWAEVEAEVKEAEAERAESAGAVLSHAMKEAKLDVTPGKEGADADGVVRRDTLLSEAESRNKKLERIPDGTTASPPKPGTAHSSPQSSTGWGRSFRVEWIKVGRLPFAKTRHITNSFNQDREVKVSRDGTEVEPRAGEELIRTWDAEEEPGGGVGMGASSGMARAASSQ